LTIGHQLTGPLNGLSNCFPLSLSTALSEARLPWWGDAEDWILIGWMCHMTMLGIHANLQYGDVMTSRSKGIGQWKHHILEPKKYVVTFW